MLFGQAMHPQVGPNAGWREETWAWRQGSWHQLFPSTTPQPDAAPGGMAMAYDEHQKELILFGGLDGAPPAAAQTWTWTGTDWKQLHPKTNPPGSNSPLLAYDAKLGKVIALVDSCSTYQCVAVSKTWSWDGSDWTPLNLPTDPPGPRSSESMVYDGADGTLVLYGRTVRCPDPANCIEDPETWTFDGATWTRHAAASDGPRGRSGAAMAYDLASGRVFMFGGHLGDFFGPNPLGDAWTWNGSAWAPAPGGGPAPRGGAIAAYDPNLGAVILYGGGLRSQQLGGGASFYDTWSWKAGSWTQLQPTTAPAPAATGLAMVQAATDWPTVPPTACPSGSTTCSPMSVHGSPMLGAGGVGYVVFNMPAAWPQGPICVAYLSNGPTWHADNFLCGPNLPQAGAQAVVSVNGCANVRTFPAHGGIVACVASGTLVTVDDGPALDYDVPPFWWHVKGLGWISHQLLIPPASYVASGARTTP